MSDDPFAFDDETKALIARSIEARGNVMTLGTQTWDEWKIIGKAIDTMRRKIMDRVGKNNPQANEVRKEMGRVLKETGHDTIHKTVRSKLQSCHDKLPGIEAWRETWTIDQRRAWNHPDLVWSKYNSFLKSGEDKVEKPNPLKEKIVRLEEEAKDLEEEMTELRQRNAELEEETETPSNWERRFKIVRDAFNKIENRDEILAAMGTEAAEALGYHVVPPDEPVAALAQKSRLPKGTSERIEKRGGARPGAGRKRSAQSTSPEAPASPLSAQARASSKKKGEGG